MKPQHILAVSSSALYDELGSRDNAPVATVFAAMPVCTNNADLFIIQREYAEKATAFRHIIPYVVIVDRQGRILMYQRGAGVGEQRLAGQCSVGFGGHVDLHDVRYDDSVIDLNNTLEGCALRELEEELGVMPHQLTRIEERGIILDDSNEVGRVHVGQLLIADYVDNPAKVKIKEEELSLVGWFLPEQIDLETLEPWSKAAVIYLMALRGMERVEPTTEAVSKAEELTEINPVEGVVEKNSCWGRLLGTLCILGLMSLISFLGFPNQ